MSKPVLTVTSDFTKQFNESIKRFKNDAVLVGVPQENNGRSDKDAQPMNNATLMAIANFGSPANNIPPWPIMAIGIKAVKDQVAEQFKKAAQGVLDKGTQAADIYYNRAGLIASNSIKKTLNDQIGVPPDKPSPATMRLRAAAGFKGTKYWLVSGQLRNSITYVITGKGK